MVAKRELNLERLTLTRRIRCDACLLGRFDDDTGSALSESPCRLRDRLLLTAWAAVAIWSNVPWLR